MAGIPTTPLPAVRVAWRPEQFNRVTNPGFETNTTGWSASAGINAAATSITRITTDAHGGSACASVVCTGTYGSGVNWDFGSARFHGEASTGAVYTATGWIRRVSGSRRARVILGSEGTSTDRATLVLRDLPDAWVPFRVTWLPTASRTDVQLAVTNGSSQAITFRLDDVTVWLDGMTQVENGSFEVDTTGWSAFLGGSIARSTAESFGGSACARVTSVATLYSGTSIPVPGTFVGGRTYRLRLAVKHISGDTDWFAQLRSDAGSETSTASATISSYVSNTTFRYHVADLTPAADRTDMQIQIGCGTLNPSVLAIDEVEVYEAADDLGTDAGELTWSRSLEGIGTATVRLSDTSGRYDPRYSSSTLYGSVSPGKRMLIRSTYGGALYGNFCGTLTTIEPQPLDGRVTLVAEDMLGQLARSTVGVPFMPDATYANVRGRVLASALAGTSDLADAASGRIAATTGLEDSTFYAATDGPVGVLDLLAELNEATQSVHWCQPSPHAAMGWRYQVQDRATLTDGTSDVTVDEAAPPAAIDGLRLSHEALENRQEVPWQGYERLVPLDADDTGAGVLMIARVPSVWSDADANDPYLHYTSDAYGTDDDHPDSRWRYPHGMTRRQWIRRKRRGLKVKRRTRVYPDAFLPISLPLGWLASYILDFAVPVADVSIDVWNDTPVAITSIEADYVERRPNRVVVDLFDTPTVTSSPPPYISRFEVSGVPYLAADDREALVDAPDSQAAHGLRAGPGISTSYLPSAGAAEGVGAFRNWRYGTPRLRPTLTDHNVFGRTLTTDLTAHVTVTADRWRLSAVPLVVTAAQWTVSAGGLDWTSQLELEELPAHTAWLTLDDATKGLDDAVVLAY